MSHTEPDLRERRTIEDMLIARMPVRRIVERLGRHRSTICREIRRNRFEDGELPEYGGYDGVVADRKARARRHRLRKLVRLPALRTAVVERLEAGWSPEQISGRLRRDCAPVGVCHEMIYAYACSRDGRDLGLRA